VRRIVSLLAVAGVAMLGGCGGADDPDIVLPDAVEIITIAPGSEADFQGGEVTVTVGEVDGDSVTVTAVAGTDEVSIDGEAGARDDVGDFEVVITHVDDEAVTIAVGAG